MVETPVLADVPVLAEAAVTIVALFLPGMREVDGTP